MDYCKFAPNQTKSMKKLAASVVALVLMGSVAIAQDKMKTEKTETKKETKKTTTKTEKTTSADGKKETKKTEKKMETKKTETKK